MLHKKIILSISQ